jgi:hypothetical protein
MAPACDRFINMPHAGSRAARQLGIGAPRALRLPVEDSRAWAHGRGCAEGGGHQMKRGRRTRDCRHSSNSEEGGDEVKGYGEAGLRTKLPSVSTSATTLVVRPPRDLPMA